MERPVAPRNLAELRVIRGVTGEVDRVGAGAQRPPAPQCAHAIERRAAARVLRRYARDAEAVGIEGIPPIELGHGAAAPAPDVACHAERRKPAGRWMAV